MAAEVGVFQGGFMAHNLHGWKEHYVAIDSWSHRSDGTSDKNSKDPEWHRHNYGLAWERTRRWHERVTFVRNVSLEAASGFASGTFDWVFIDALHTYDAVLADLRAWWPKLREGGLLSGDDYGDSQPTPFVSHHKYLQGGPGVPLRVAMDADAEWERAHDLQRTGDYWEVPRNFRWGVIRATQDFAREVGAVLQTSWLAGHGTLDDPSYQTGSRPRCYTWPAWYIVKPYAGDHVESSPRLSDGPRHSTRRRARILQAASQQSQPTQHKADGGRQATQGSLNSTSSPHDEPSAAA